MVIIWPRNSWEHYTTLCIVYRRWVLPWSVFSWNAPHLSVEEQRRLSMISGKPYALGIHVINSVLHPFWQNTPLTSTKLVGLKCLKTLLCSTPVSLTFLDLSFSSSAACIADFFFLLVFVSVGIVVAFSIEEHTWTHLCYASKNLQEHELGALQDQILKTGDGCDIKD